MFTAISEKDLALLLTPNELQGYTARFKLDRILALIDQCLSQIQPARNQDKLLFIGPTGAGKSTLLNYLYGARYQIKTSLGGKPSAICIDGIEVAEPGKTMSSKTLFPLVMKQSGLNYVYCDLAGLGETRGIEEQICAATAIQILSRFSGGIKGILVVIDLPSLQAARGEAFKKTAVALAKMLQFNSELMDSVYFAITKVPSDTSITPKDIIDTYISELLFTLQEDLEKSPDEEKKALQFMLSAMIKKESHILIPNIDDQGQSRKSMVNFFKKMPVKPSSGYDFTNHDEAEKHFIELIKKLAKAYCDRYKILRYDFPNETLNLLTKKEACDLKLKKIELDIFQEENMLKKIVDQKNNIEKQIKLIGSSSPEILDLVKKEGEVRLEIEKRKQLLEHLNNSKKDLLIERKALEKALANIAQSVKDSSLILEATQNVFSIIYKLTHMLDLGQEKIVANFWQEYEQNHSNLNLNNSSLRTVLFTPKEVTSKINLAEEVNPFLVNHVGYNVKNAVKNLRSSIKKSEVKVKNSTFNKFQ